MKIEDRLLTAFAQETTASTDDVHAVRRRLEARGVLTSPSTGLLGILREESRNMPASRSRIIARRRGWSWRPALGAAMAAAALVLAVSWWAPAGIRATDSALLATSLVSEQDVAHLTPTRAVSLGFKGQGHVEGTPKAPIIIWEVGTLAVEVDPGQGVDLWVETREARIHVVGTVFTVNRHGGGTEVSVDRGRVQVLCRAGESTLIEAGQSCTCTPVSAASLLGYARRQQDKGAPAADVLTTTEQGLFLATPGNAVFSELTILKMQTLRSLGRDGEALELAESYLDAGYPLRRASVHRLAADLANAVGDPACANRHMEAAAAP